MVSFLSGERKVYRSNSSMAIRIYSSTCEIFLEFSTAFCRREEHIFLFNSSLYSTFSKAFLPTQPDSTPIHSIKQSVNDCFYIFLDFCYFPAIGWLKQLHSKRYSCSNYFIYDSSMLFGFRLSFTLSSNFLLKKYFTLMFSPRTQ